MMNIDVLFSFKNYVCIKDRTTGYIWLYSYNKPLCWYDMEKLYLIKKNITTQTNKKHITLFKDYLKEKFKL